jgi:transcriptional regulator with XRE-family HTH domain
MKEIITEICKKHRITRSELAEELGISRTTLWRLEKNETAPIPKLFNKYIKEVIQGK